MNKQHHIFLIKTLAILAIILALNGCGFCNVFYKQYYFTSEGGVRPGKNKFYNKDTPYILKELDLIKTDCVYQLCSVWNSDEVKYLSDDCDDKNAKISFIRFFKNGRFLMNRLDNKKSHLEQYNNLKSGKIGYYSIEENILTLEYFSVKIGGMASDCGEYYREQYELNENGIKLYAVRRSNNGTFYKWHPITEGYWYNKKQVFGLTGIPDW